MSAATASLDAIQAAIRADAVRAREVEVIGPFVCTFSPSTKNVFLNYAIPETAAEPTARDVATLVATFRSRARVPRLEYLPALAPAVEGALTANGFVAEMRTPLMLLCSTGAVVVPAPDGTEIVDVESDEDVYAASLVQNEAYGEAEPPNESSLRSVRRNLDAGGLLVLARDAETGEPAGAGACTAPHEGACELTSVGVREQFRRRGIAAAVASRLALRATEAGTSAVFLMAHGEPETRIYERAGFERIGEVLHISAPG